MRVRPPHLEKWDFFGRETLEPGPELRGGRQIGRDLVAEPDAHLLPQRAHLLQLKT